MLKKIALVVLLIFSSRAFAQIGMDQTAGIPSNYVFTHGQGWQPPVSGGTGVNSLGIGTIPTFMSYTLTNPTSSPVLSWGFDSSGPHEFLGNNTGSTGSIGFVQPAFADLSGSATLAQIVAALPSANRIFYATNYTGADMGADIGLALADAYAAGGGTVDARGFVCPAKCHIGTANLVVGDGTHYITLLLPTGMITRGTIVATGKSAQIIYNSHATIIGAGAGATIISGPSDTTAVQQANNANGVGSPKLVGFSITDTGSTVAGSAGLMIGGKNADGSRGQDVLHGWFQNLSVGGSADFGTLMDSQHGCICYNKVVDVDSSGKTAGIKTANDSGYAFGVNSNQWTGGNIGGPVGLWDSGTTKFTFSWLDFENNRSATGAVLYANPDRNNAGTGYAVGDTVQPAGGDGTAVLTVATVAGGVPTSLTVTTPGSTYANLQSQATTTLAGSGTGLKVDLRVSAYMLLLSNGGDLIINPYEEAGGGDYICGIGNYVTGSFFSGNGAIYGPKYCTGPTGGYGGPASNFVWGPGMTPGSIGLGGSRPYIAFGSSGMFDAHLATAYQSRGSSVNLWADGPSYGGITSAIYGPYGHSDWNVGVSKPHAGVIDTGRVTVSKLPTPKAPAVAIGAGTAGSTSYSYGFACTSDGNSGVPLPGPMSSPVTGPDVLGAWLTAAPVAGGTGYSVNDVVTVTGGSGTAQLTVTSVDSTGAVTGLSVTTPGSIYRLTGRGGTGDATAFATTGGSGSGLRVTGTASYMKIAFTPPDGCKAFVILKGDSSHKIDTSSGVGWNSLTQAWLDYGATTVAYSAPSRDSTGDVQVAGTINGIRFLTGASAPTGSCAAPAIYLTTAGAMYNCESGSWVAK